MTIHTASSFSRSEYQRCISEDGFVIVAEVLTARQVIELREAVSQLPEGEEVRRKANVYGVRNLLELSSAVCDLAASRTIVAGTAKKLHRTRRNSQHTSAQSLSEVPS